MSYQKQQFGIMDQGYFVPRSQITVWINDLLKINISKIQALGSGSIYCQIFDVIHPGKIPMAKVNWKAKNDNQFLQNFRLLQTGLEKANIKRHIEVQKLVKAKYQDNLELIQWLKRYFDINCGSKGQGYNAVQKRNKVVPDFSFAQKLVVPKMYNGTGQVATKDKLVSPVKKKQQIPAKLKSPRTVNTPITSNRIKSPVIQKRQEIKKKPVEPIKKATQPVVVPKKNEVKNVVTKVIPGANSQSVKVYESKIKQLEQKIQMIKQVVRSQQESGMKIDLISEILSIQTKKKDEQDNKQTHKKHSVQNEVVLLGENNEDFAQNVEPQQNLCEDTQNHDLKNEQESASVQNSASNAQKSQVNNTSHQEEEKPDFSQIAQSQHDDDVI